MAATLTLIAHTTANTAPTLTQSTGALSVTNATLDASSGDIFVAGDVLIVVVADTLTGTTLSNTAGSTSNSRSNSWESLSDGTTESLTVSDCDAANGAGAIFTRIWSSRVTHLSDGSIPNASTLSSTVTYGGSSGTRRTRYYRLRPDTGKTIGVRATRLKGTYSYSGGTTSNGGTDTLTLSGTSLLDCALLLGFYTSSTMTNAPTYDADNDGTFELTADSNASGIGSFAQIYAAAASHRPTTTEVIKFNSNPGATAKAVGAVIYQAAQTTNTTVTLNDTVGVANSCVGIVVLSRSNSDSTGITGTVVAPGTKSRSLTNAVAITETVAGRKATSAAATDTVGVTDSVVVVRGVLVSLSDTVGVTGSIASHATASRTLPESVAVTATVASLKTTSVSLTDQVDITGTGTASRSHSLQLSNLVEITATIHENDQAVRNFNATVGITETVAASVVLAEGLNDTVGIAASVGVASHLIIPLSESVGIADIVTANVSSAGHSSVSFVNFVGITETAVAHTSFRVVFGDDATEINADIAPASGHHYQITDTTGIDGTVAQPEVHLTLGFVDAVGVSGAATTRPPIHIFDAVGLTGTVGLASTGAVFCSDSVDVVAVMIGAAFGVRKYLAPTKVVLVTRSGADYAVGATHNDFVMLT